MTAPPKQLSVADAEGVLSVVPHTLGFHPRESLVVLIIAGTVLSATLRVDLPEKDPPDSDAASAHAGTVARYVRELPGATGAFLVAYSGREPDVRSPYFRLVRALASTLRRGGISVPDAWYVGPTGWRSYFCPDGDCCPPGGHPLESVWLSDANLGLVLGGSSPRRGHWDGSPVRVWKQRDAVRAAVAAALPGRGPSAPELLERWCAALVGDPEATLERLRSDPVAAGTLLAGLRTLPVRDALPFAAGVSGAAALAAVADIEGGVQDGPAARQLGRFLLGDSRSAPDWRRLDLLWEVGRELLGAADGADRSALLCVLAWVEWARGRSSPAAVLLEACLRADPGHALARGLLAFVGRGVLPGWARDPATSWHRFGAP